MRRLSSSKPSPAPSTPQLLDTVSKSVPPCSSKASISRIGTPHSPKPPTASDAPSGMSRTAAATELTVLSIYALPASSPAPHPTQAAAGRVRGRGRSGQEAPMTAVAPAAATVQAHATSSRLGVRIVHSVPDLVTSALAGFALPAMVLLLAGRFSPGWVLPAGVAGAAVAVAVCGAGSEQVDRRALRYTLIAIGLAFAWCVVNSFFSAENLFAHRDPATYNLTGRWLMDHPGLGIPAQPEIFGSPSSGSGSSAGFGVSGPTQLYAQGNHLLPALLAVVGWVFGVTALLKANVTFGALALLAFFGLARRVVDAPLALVAMVAVAVSMPLIFVSRDTYSEPLALLFLVGGLGLLHRAVESGRVRDFALAGFVLGTSAMARIDSHVSLLAVLVTAAVFPIFAARTARTTAVWQACALVGGTVVPVLVGWLDVAHLSYGYYRADRHVDEEDVPPVERADQQPAQGGSGDRSDAGDSAPDPERGTAPFRREDPGQDRQRLRHQQRGAHALHGAESD